jgi:hypothetical protein
LYSGGLSEGKSPYKREYYTDSEGKRQYTGKEEPIYFTDEDSPFREQLPSNVFPREVRGRQAIEGVAERTRQGLSSTWDVAKRFFGNYLPARRPDPNVPDRPLWRPISEAGASTRPTSPDVIYNPPPADEPPFEEVDPAIGLEQEIENILIREREKQLKYFPGHPLYEAPFEPGTGPMATTEVEDFSAIQEANQQRMEREAVQERRAEQRTAEEDKRRAAERTEAERDRKRANRERKKAERKVKIARNEKARGSAKRDRLEALSRERDAERRVAKAKRSRQEQVEAAERKRQQQRESAKIRAAEAVAHREQQSRAAAARARRVKPTPVRRRRGGRPASRRVSKQPSRGRGR